jgi:formylglycine-generating enzyme required for sulfatase activity
MVRLPGSGCIDAYEVSNQAYFDWLDGGPSTSGQIEACSFNTDFLPAHSPSATEWSLPVMGVDWCDAKAFCDSMGKRLCGSRDGGSASTMSSANLGEEWFWACSSGGTNAFAYGNTGDVNSCNTRDSMGSVGPPPLLASGTMLTCQSQAPGFSGVFDLGGNVWEWEDACSSVDGGNDECRARGGSVNDFSHPCDSQIPGASFILRLRSARQGLIGVRCCAD